MRIPIALDRGGARPLAGQLADRLADAIREGRIPPGARLPSSRRLSEQLGLGRNTVMRAYEALLEEGLVESRAASGIFPARDLSPSRVRPVLSTSGSQESTSDVPRMPEPTVPVAPERIESSRVRTLYDFVPGRPNPELFPVKTWRRLVQSSLSYRGVAGFSEQGDPIGLYALRSAIAAHVSMNRGIVADPEQIVIVLGAQEALTLVARLLLSPESTAIVEDPCYAGGALVLRATGARLLGIPVDEDGLITARLPRERAALVYVTPAHQYPTGYALSAPRRQELVAWARARGTYVVEDDYDGDFHYDGSPLQALAGTAPDCTIHVGTFTTTLGAGLRLGYIVAPPQLVGPLRAAKALLNTGSPWLDQAVLAEFIRAGSYDAHLTRCRAQYREARDALLGALRRHFGRVAISGETSGLQLLWQLPAGVPEAPRLEELARRHRVGVYCLASVGVHEIAPSPLMRRSLLLGYAGLEPKQIEQGILRLSDAVDDTLDDHHEFIGELLLDEPSARRARPAAPSRRGSRRAPLLRQMPAIRTVSPRPRGRRSREEPTPMRTVVGICRYPIKGLSPEPLRGVTLEAGKPFPFDRVFALTRPGVSMDSSAPRWAKKGLFLMLMLDEALALVHTALDVETLQLTVSRPRRGANGVNVPGDVLLSADLRTEEGRDAAAAFFGRQVPTLKGATKLVHMPNGHFMDKPDNVVSCINLATLRSLEAQWGCKIDPYRFRANFYIDGARPWEEFDWVGSDIMLGDVLFRVDRRNGRCGATNVNPVTGERDLDIPGSLRKSFGHKDLGVYLVALKAGKVVVGDQVTVPELGDSSPEAAPVPAPLLGGGAYICRGCYYVYDESKGAPGVAPGTRFDAIGASFRCPDCGTDKGNFRPYVTELGPSGGTQPNALPAQGRG